MRNGELLSRTESAALRGIAILGIILHNYCHFLGFAVKENEYKFDSSRPMQFFDKLFSLDSDLFIHFFSFLGHYGVPIFLFISGYGLVKKYEAHPQTGNENPSRWEGHSVGFTFIRKHFLKLFRLMIIGYLVFIGVYLLRHSDGAQVYSWDHVLTQLTMTINFFYFDPDHIIKPGPYWYFGLMLQLYILYILVIYRWRQNSLLIALAAGSILLEACFGNQQDWLNYIRYNFIGGMLPFGLGVIFGGTEVRGYGGTRLPWRVLSAAGVFSHPRTPVPPYLRIISLLLALASIPLVLVMSFSFHSWLWIPVVIIIGTIALVKALPAVILKIFVFFGTYSAAMFVAHPIARKLFITVAWQRDAYDGLMLYFVAAIGLSWAVKMIIDCIPSPKM